jgi:hypothetical protein
MFKLIAFAALAAITAVVVTSEAAGSGGSDVHSTAAEVGYAQSASASTPAAAARRRRRVCDRNYRGRCLRPNVSDYDCAGGSGNGPYYVRGPFTVVGTDHYRLDSDGDGVACES